MARWGVGTARALVHFTVSGDSRSWACLVALIFREPSRALAAQERGRRARLGCWSVEAQPCRFLARLPQQRAAQRSCAAGKNPQKSSGLHTTTLHRVAWAAGGARGEGMKLTVGFCAVHGALHSLSGRYTQHDLRARSIHCQNRAINPCQIFNGGKVLN
jgi:hypothetical protein